MNTIEWAKKKMSTKGWVVKEISWEPLRSGFKSIDGGWLCLFETEYGDKNYNKEIDSIKNDPLIEGVIQPGLIMSLTAKSFRKLINKIPSRNSLSIE